MEQLQNETRTIVIYEAPHRLIKTLKELEEVLGDRELTICRELTKRYEEAIQTTLKEAVKYYETREPKGEFVLVIAGKPEEEIEEEKRKQWENMSVQEHVDHYIRLGNDKKEAMKLTAKDRGVSKREIYNQLLS